MGASRRDDRRSPWPILVLFTNAILGGCGGGGAPGGGESPAPAESAAAPAPASADSTAGADAGGIAVSGFQTPAPPMG
jgi:hypothetical protein